MADKYRVILERNGDKIYSLEDFTYENLSAGLDRMLMYVQPLKNEKRSGNERRKIRYGRRKFQRRKSDV